jgi:hypothetical protein
MAIRPMSSSSGASGIRPRAFEITGHVLVSGRRPAKTHDRRNALYRKRSSARTSRDSRRREIDSNHRYREDKLPVRDGSGSRTGIVSFAAGNAPSHVGRKWISIWLAPTSMRWIRGKEGTLAWSGQFGPALLPRLATAWMTPPRRQSTCLASALTGGGVRLAGDLSAHPADVGDKAL